MLRVLPLAAKQELLSWARHHAIELVPALSGACQQPEVSQSVYLWKGNQHNPEATTAAHRLEKKVHVVGASLSSPEDPVENLT